MKVRLAGSARRHVRAIVAWIKQHGDVAPFRRELLAAFAQLTAAPRSGVPYAGSPDVRRLLLRTTRYHVYYVVEGDEVHIVAVWHGARGTGPAL